MSDSSQQPGGGATMVAGHSPNAPVGAPQQVLATPSGALSNDLVGTVLSDRYRIIKKLGEGGMGSVYLAEHTTINKKLAIKVLSPEYSHKQDLVDRFLQEARAASMIEQQNVVEITDFGSTPSGSVFFVMEYLNGEDLSSTIKNEGPLPWERVKPIALQICDALTAAHEAGIIHRDMKPENCYRIRRGSNADFIKVLDFGIAKVTSDEGDGGGRNLTRTGMIFGTPEYMSPEQAKGERVDRRVDIYALGVILYELLTGRVPFTADTFMGILTKHMFEAPPAPSSVVPDTRIDPEVEAIILKALQKDREYRFQDMREMAEAIRAVGTGSGAVEVVPESVMGPATGQIRFAGQGTHTQIGSDLETADDVVRPNNMGTVIGIAAFAVVLVGGAAAWGMGLFDGAPEPPSDPNPTPAVVESEPVEPEPTEPEPTEPEPTPPEPVHHKVTVTVSVPGVEGTVYDNRDDAILGKTNEPFELPYGSEPVDVYVQAEGYEDGLTDLVPDADKTIEVPLTKLERGKPKSSTKRRKKSSSKKGSSSTQDSASSKGGPEPKQDSPSKEPEQPKKKKGSELSEDLKDPFAQ